MTSSLALFVLDTGFGTSPFALPSSNAVLAAPLKRVSNSLIFLSSLNPLISQKVWNSSMKLITDSWVVYPLKVGTERFISWSSWGLLREFRGLLPGRITLEILRCNPLAGLGLFREFAG